MSDRLVKAIWCVIAFASALAASIGLYTVSGLGLTRLGPDLYQWLAYRLADLLLNSILGVVAGGTCIYWGARRRWPSLTTAGITLVVAAIALPIVSMIIDF